MTIRAKLLNSIVYKPTSHSIAYEGVRWSVTKKENMGILDLYINPPKIKVPKRNSYKFQNGEWVLDSSTTGKAWLTKFWDEFGGNKNLGWKHSRKKKLKLLRELSAVVILERKGDDLKRYRAKFDLIKNDRHWLRSHPMCFVCGAKATLRHHILQLKNGGHNAKRNLVSLSEPCHADIHPWLKTKLKSKT